METPLFTSYLGHGPGPYGPAWYNAIGRFSAAALHDLEDLWSALVCYPLDSREVQQVDTVRLRDHLLIWQTYVLGPQRPSRRWREVSEVPPLAPGLRAAVVAPIADRMLDLLDHLDGRGPWGGPSPLDAVEDMIRPLRLSLELVEIERAKSNVPLDS